MIGTIAKILKALNSETAPGQISMALCFALIIGLTPLYSLHNLLVLLLVLILRVNLSAFIVGWVFFSGVAYILDPIFQHGIGLINNRIIGGFVDIALQHHDFQVCKIQQFHRYGKCAVLFDFISTCLFCVQYADYQIPGSHTRLGQEDPIDAVNKRK